MPWVRFDDQFTIHRKVNGLTDTEFRLHVEAVFWCARNLTDGRVGRDELDLVCRIRSPKKHVAKLVDRGMWHRSGQGCDSPKCPAHVDNGGPADAGGWIIHDYLEYQFSKERVMNERKKTAQRVRKHRDQRKPDRNGVTNDVGNGVGNRAPSRPDPSRRDGEVHVGDHPPRRNTRGNEHDDDQDPIIQTIIGVLADQTGHTVEPDWADRVRAQILAGRTPRDPTAYVRACINASPHDYLPTGEGHPSTRSVAEALRAARGEP